MTTPLEGRHTGRFSYDVLADAWRWDDEMFRLHGYEPGSVEPTTRLVLERNHSADRVRVKELLGRIRTAGVPFSIAYRVIGADGIERHVVAVGQGTRNEADDATTIEGFYIDLTAEFSDESELYARAAIEAAADSRAVIEQAKGVLMLAFGLGPTQAFAMLGWWSRNHKIKIRDLAERLVLLAGAGQNSDADLRGQTDALLHDLTMGVARETAL